MRAAHSERNIAHGATARLRILATQSAAANALL